MHSTNSNTDAVYEKIFSTEQTSQVDPKQVAQELEATLPGKNIELVLAFSPHDSADDVEFLEHVIPAADIVIPEQPGHDVDDFEELQAISRVDGMAAEFAEEMQSVCDDSSFEDCRLRLYQLLSQNNVPTTLIDEPAGTPLEEKLLRYQGEVEEAKMEHLNQPDDFFKEYETLLRAERERNQQREHNMLHRLPTALSSASLNIEGLADKDTVQVVLTMGSNHDSLSTLITDVASHSENIHLKNVYSYYPHVSSYESKCIAAEPQSDTAQLYLRLHYIMEEMLVADEWRKSLFSNKQLSMVAIGSLLESHLLNGESDLSQLAMNSINNLFTTLEATEDEDERPAHIEAWLNKHGIDLPTDKSEVETMALKIVQPYAPGL